MKLSAVTKRKEKPSRDSRFEGLGQATASLVASSPKTPGFSGYLLKLPVDKPKRSASKSGSSRSHWQRRWFTLRGSTLEYRHSKDSSKPRGTITLGEGAICSETDNSTRTFEIWSFNGTVVLRAETFGDKQRWFTALRNVCKIRTMKDQGLEDNTPEDDLAKLGPSSRAASPRVVTKALVDYKRRTSMLKTSTGTYLLQVPTIVKDLVDWLADHGREHEGLFRVPAEATAVKTLIQNYHDRETDDNRVKALLAGTKGSTRPMKSNLTLLQALAMDR